MNLPGSVFSRKQLDLFLWLLRVNQDNNALSTKTMKEINNSLQNLYSIKTITYNGKQGHKYHVNSLAQILAQVKL